MRLSSKLDGGDFIGLYWKTIGWSFLLSFVLSGYVAVVALIVGSMGGPTAGESVFANPELYTSIPFLALTVVGYLAWAMGMNVFMRLYLVRDLWQRAVSSITVHGIEAAANVAARGDLANAIGEGFADGLDVGGL